MHSFACQILEEPNVQWPPFQFRKSTFHFMSCCTRRFRFLECCLAKILVNKSLWKCQRLWVFAKSKSLKFHAYISWKFQEHLARFTHLQVDSVSTKHQSQLHVLFISTREGSVKKLSYNSRSQSTCLVEILHPFAQNGRSISILNMKLHASALYLATEENVVKFKVSRCQRFRTQRACLNAMDPYCGWDQQTNECVSTPNGNPRAAYWQQSLLTCPIMSDPVSSAPCLQNVLPLFHLKNVFIRVL